MRDTELLARVDAAMLTPQPLAVEQMRARELGPQQGAAQPLDRFLIQALGGLARAHQGTGTSVDSEGRVTAGESRGRNDALESDARQLRVPAPGCSFQQLHRHPSGDKQLVRAIVEWVPGGSHRVLVAAQAVAQKCQHPVGRPQTCSPARGGVFLSPRLDQGTSLGLTAAKSREHNGVKARYLGSGRLALSHRPRRSPRRRWRNRHNARQ